MKYCARCGSKLFWSKWQGTGVFNQDTGDEEQHRQLLCPKYEKMPWYKKFLSNTHAFRIRHNGFESVYYIMHNEYRWKGAKK